MTPIDSGGFAEHGKMRRVRCEQIGTEEEPGELSSPVGVWRPLWEE
jgi:hypothetical protein